MKTGNITEPAPNDSGHANIWQEHYRIRSYEVDCRNRLSILSIINYMQEAASRHAESLGVSIQQLLNENRTWLLSRLKIKISAYPGWNDRVRINTWPTGAQQLFALRDFKLSDGRSRPLAAAISAWLVIDLEKRRPIRIDSFLKRLNPVDGCHTIDGGLGKLPALKNHTHESLFVVRYSDLDINQHANNVKFVEWVIESLPAPVLDSRALSGLEVNFLAEAFHGDQIIATCSAQNADNTRFLHCLTRKQDGRELLRAVTDWGDIARVPGPIGGKTDEP